MGPRSWSSVTADEAARERIAALLGPHSAAGRFEADELSRRLDLAFGDDLPQLALEGLPPLEAAPPSKRRWGRRHGEADAAQPTWMPTKERFVDPTTQRVVRVWIDPAD